MVRAGQHVVVLVPAGRTLGGAAAEVALGVHQQLGAGDYEGVLLAAAQSLGLEDAMPTWCFATRERPLVIDAANDRITLGPVVLALTPNQRAMIATLAKGRPMGPKDLGLAMSPNATIPDQVVRKACLDLDERVEASFRDAGAAMRDEWTPLVVQDRMLGYRLSVGCIVR
jgi:hypothetical protein